MRLIFLCVLLWSLNENILRADIAPPPRLTPAQEKEQKRQIHKFDDCMKRKVRASCKTMEGNRGTCKWFSWWWKPDSNERVFEGGYSEFASYQTQCTVVKKKVMAQSGKLQEIDTNKCLVCM